MLISIEIHRTFDFPGGTDHLSPSGSAHELHVYHECLGIV